MLLLGGQVYDLDGITALTGDPQAPQADLDYIVKRHREKGFRSAFSPPLHDEDSARRIGDAFREAGILLVEYGYWDNLLDTDPTTRTRNRQGMLRALFLAEEAGITCCLNILGSYCHGHGTTSHHPRNFSEDAFAEAVDMARWLIDTVQPKRTSFAYEIFPFGVIDSPEACARLVRAVDRPAFAVHLDLVNMVGSARSYWNTGPLLEETLRLVGDRVVSVHLKDIAMERPAASVILREVTCGEGVVDFIHLLRQLHTLRRPLPVLIEHLHSEIEYDQSSSYLRKQAAQAGVDLPM